MNEEVIIIAIIAILIGIIIVFLVQMTQKFKRSYQLKESERSVEELLRTTGSLVDSQIKKAKKFIQRNISRSYLTGTTWILSNDYTANILFTFRNSGELLITRNGIVERAQYELIVDNNSILISAQGVTEHYAIINIYDDFFFLNKISTNSILVFANQTKFKDEVKQIINQHAKELYEF